MTIRILVADDHPAVRHGLRTLLGGQPEWEIIDEAEDGVEAVEKADLLKPDVILLDISMPRMEARTRISGLRPFQNEPKAVSV